MNLVVEMPIDARPGETERRLTRTNRRNVSIVRPGKVAFEIELKSTRDHSLAELDQAIRN